jgi:hypothetical protein
MGKKVHATFSTLAQALTVNPIGQLPVNQLNQCLKLKDAPPRLWVIYSPDLAQVWSKTGLE